MFYSKKIVILIFVLLAEILFSGPSFSTECLPKKGVLQIIVESYERSLNRLSAYFNFGQKLGEKFESGARKIILPDWGNLEITTKKLLPDYVGETSPAKVNKLFNLNNKAGVTYFSKIEAEKFELHFGSDGKIYDHAGKIFDTQDAYELDKFGEKRKLSNVGVAVVVMDEKGRIFAHKRPQVGVIHHSSLVAGGPVGFAGEIEVKNGVVKKVTNISGHYHPGEQHLWQFLDRLRLGVKDLEVEQIEKIVVKN